MSRARGPRRSGRRKWDPQPWKTDQNCRIRPGAAGRPGRASAALCGRRRLTRGPASTSSRLIPRVEDSPPDALPPPPAGYLPDALIRVDVATRAMTAKVDGGDRQVSKVRTSPTSRSCRGRRRASPSTSGGFLRGRDSWPRLRRRAPRPSPMRAAVNRFGSVHGSRAYPRTFAPRCASHRANQPPLKPVCPVRKTRRPLQKPLEELSFTRSSMGPFRCSRALRGDACREAYPSPARSPYGRRPGPRLVGQGSR